MDKFDKNKGLTSGLSHFNREGEARMVNVSDKSITHREAISTGSISMKQGTLKLITERKMAKGDVLSVARIAGIMAAKKTADLIPMCHPLGITAVQVDFDIDRENNKIVIKTTVEIIGRTGVEMEALLATSVAALTIYDMCKAVDRGMVISDIMLLEKRGGKSGVFKRA
ncbi:MAG: cyclic pyranopterin monophosphate synthase MoaC [Dissulfurispiraceae bacterium]